MARYIGPKCRLCRREGMKLFLKGERCHTAKCAIAKRGDAFPPGGRAIKRGRVSEYGNQLREKQRLKRYFGLLDRQFRGVFVRAVKDRGNTGTALLNIIERRLDNVVRQSGFSLGPASARQLVAHGLVKVNGHKVDRPSYSVKAGDVISFTSRNAPASASRKSSKVRSPSRCVRRGSSVTSRRSPSRCCVSRPATSSRSSCASS